MTNTQDTNWTIAYRNRRANRFQRATDLATDWHRAMEVARRVGRVRSELEVFVTTTAAAERSGFTVAEDVGNILTDSGRRVRVFDNGSVHSLLATEV